MTPMKTRRKISRDAVPLAGSERHGLPGALEIGPCDPAEPLTVTVYVRQRGAPIDIRELGLTPPHKRKYLTYKQMVARHGAAVGGAGGVNQSGARREPWVLHSAALRQILPPPERRYEGSQRPLCGRARLGSVHRLGHASRRKVASGAGKHSSRPGPKRREWGRHSHTGFSIALGRLRRLSSHFHSQTFDTDFPSASTSYSKTVVISFSCANFFEAV